MKKFKLFKMLAVLIVLITSINTAWGWSGIKLRGDWMGGFSYQSDTWTYGGEGNKYWDVYHPGGTKYWRLHLDYFNHDVGPNTANYVLNVGTTGYKVVNTGDKAFKTTANAGILRIQTSQTNDGGEDERPNVWITRPTVKFKYDFENDGGDWTMVDATDNQDGTYTYRGLYCGVDYFNAGPNDADKVHLDGDTPIGSPSAGDRCEFKWQPGTGDPNTDYKYTTDESHNYGIFTITKLVTITYYANNPTSGTAPSAQEVLYDADQTLSGNTGSLTKDGYVFVGWNTASDGSGQHYDVGVTLEDIEADVDLYAEWVSGKWMVKGKGGDGAMGSDFEIPFVLRQVSANVYRGTVTLGAHQVYQFKITDNTSWYSKNFNSGESFVYVGQTGAMTLYSDVGNNCRIATGNAGNYTFEFNESSHTLTITYPNGTAHPSTNYVYYSNPDGWSTIKGYIYDASNLTSWDDSPELSSVTISGTTYYFAALGDRNDIIFRGENPSGTWHQTSNINEADDEVGHYYKTSWEQFTVRITLDNQSATSAGTEYKDVKFFYDELTTSITCPTKTGYNFGGYYTAKDGGGLQIINASGAWQASVSGYTDEDKKWIKDGGAVTLYAKWTEKKWNVTAQVSPDGTGFASPSSATSYGEVEGGAISASNNNGYHFTTWSITSGSGTFESAETTANNTFYPTAATTLTATFEANTYTINLNNKGATGGTLLSSVTATYNSNSLSTAPVPTKWGNTFGGWEDEDGTLVIDENGALIEDVENYTDEDGNWVRDEDNIDLYAVWTPKAASSIRLISGHDGEATGGTAFNETSTTGVYYVTVDMAQNDVYHFGDGTAAAGPAGASADRTYSTALDITSLAVNTYGVKYTGTNKQTVVIRIDLNSNIDNSVRLYIDHLVLYKPGDKSGDTHIAYGSEDSYASDRTVYGEFELRMSAQEDKWETLYLPFEPTSVEVYEDGTYYSVVPYIRPGGKGNPLYYGDYIIRTPESTSNVAVKDFGEWNDPNTESYSTWLPSGNTPYIIMWHDWTGGNYFNGKYISFFGNVGAGVTFASSMGAAGAAPESEGYVNIYGNPSMAIGLAQGAYVLTYDGDDVEWRRPDDPEDNSDVPALGCYVVADSETTLTNQVIGRRTGSSTTGWDDVLNGEQQTQVVVYTITGLKVAQYDNCSLTEAGRRLNATYNEGIFILRAGNESVKLIFGGK